MAEVRSLQSQLHKVIGRNASGDRTILPLSSTSEDLGMKTVLLIAKCSGTAPPFHQVFVRVEKEVGAQSPCTPIDTVRDAVRARCGIFLQAMSSSNSARSRVQPISTGAL